MAIGRCGMWSENRRSRPDTPNVRTEHRRFFERRQCESLTFVVGKKSGLSPISYPFVCCFLRTTPTDDQLLS